MHYLIEKKSYILYDINMKYNNIEDVIDDLERYFVQDVAKLIAPKNSNEFILMRLPLIGFPIIVNLNVLNNVVVSLTDRSIVL